MPQHYRLFADTKQQYGEIFRQARAALEQRLTTERTLFDCPACRTEARPDFVSWLSPLHVDCGFRSWQAAALNLLENEIGLEILTCMQQIAAYRDTFGCHMCGMCCRLASSEFSYEQLTIRAAAGDDFARQFSSIFLPYASIEAARAQYPDVVAAVLAESGATQSEPDGSQPEEATDSDQTRPAVHFYHCPYIGEDNRCTIYGTAKRPAICASYPETPLAFVYEKCAWRTWKDETHPDALLAHALLVLCEDFSARLKTALG